MKLITISGVDGSGKSTQIKLLRDHLESQGQRVFYFHAVKFGIASKLAGRVKTESGSGAGVTKANFLQICLRRIFLLIDICRFKLLRNKLRNTGYDYILSDRYFYDTIININYLSQKNRTLPCEKFIPKPDKVFYLQIETEIIMQRERKPDQGMEYLKKKSDLFRTKISSWNLRIIDANRDKNVIFEEIWSKI